MSLPVPRQLLSVPVRGTREAASWLFFDSAFAEARLHAVPGLRELRPEIRNGKERAVFSPRAYRKLPSVWRATQEPIEAEELLVA